MSAPGNEFPIDALIESLPLERAAQALAVADGMNWDSVNVRNKYRGLALVAVRTYLASRPPLGPEDGIEFQGGVR